MRTRAQMWGMDLMIAIAIFSIGAVAFYFYSVSYTSEESIIENLNYDGNIIADSLLSQGYPSNWTESNVIVSGITNEGKINQTKLEQFYNLSTSDYYRTKNLFNSRYDFWIYLSADVEINSMVIEGIGKKPINYENLIKITKVIIYNNKPETLTLQIWN